MIFNKLKNIKSLYCKDYLSWLFFLNDLKKIFKISIIISSFIVGSCSDEGCIEADDFGEYESQVVEVMANSLSESCNYESSKSITDPSQGSGLKTCFISGEVTTYDETGASRRSTSGCNGFTEEKFKNLCVQQCISECNTKNGSTVSDAEPRWSSTSKKKDGLNSGVNIRPNSFVYIRATGTVKLGDAFDYPSFFVKPNEYLPHSYDRNWNNQFLDLSAGRILTISFSGKYVDNTSYNQGASTFGEVGSGNGAAGAKTYNAARRLVVYLIPHPKYYQFDSSQNNEKTGAIGVPLLPDPDMWKCDYVGANEKNQSDCKNKIYRDNGYPRVDNSLVDKVFPVSSREAKSTLGEFGGMIRWDTDGIEADNIDPFPIANCSGSSCTGVSTVDPNKGRVAGDLSASDQLITNINYPSKISFKYLLPSTTMSCNGNIEIIVRSGTSDVSQALISANNSSWGGHISLEPGQTMVIRQNSRSFIGSAGSLNCGRALGIKIKRYHDIKIKKSGFISFATLGGTIPQNCVINARIINPEGNFLDLNAGYTADYFEYGDFSSNQDPLNNISVPAITSTSNWANSSSAKVFVRKGQVIRFSPESWNSEWTSVAGLRSCGIGMAMRIEPRPALLCRGYGEDSVDNPSCAKKFNSTGLIGCDEFDAKCNDSSDTTNYCPSSACQKPVTCTEGSSSSNPKYTRTNCSLGSLGTVSYSAPAAGTAQSVINSTCYFVASSSFNSTSCNNCSNLRKVAAEQSPYIIQQGMSICYDLEEYKGKVSNIPLTGITSTNLSNPLIAKGATKLGNFNGEYGNFDIFKDIFKVDSEFQNNKFFQISQILNISDPGRLKFMLLDGNDFKSFNNFYSDNTDPGTSYNGVNGFRVSLSSYLDFLNGAWLEAKFCKEDSDVSDVCKSTSIPISVVGQPKIVELATPSSSTSKPQSVTNFLFDDFGNLTRTAVGSDAGNCQNILIGDSYYCHTDTTSNLSLLRLSFKIKDPETANCDISNPTRVRNAETDPSFNGIKILNTKYRPNDCGRTNPEVKDGITVVNGAGVQSCVANSATGQICTTADLASNDGCSKQYICSSKYANNSGKYYVTVRVKNPDNNSISKVVNNIVSPVIEVMDGKYEVVDGERKQIKMGQAERIYKLIITDPRYKAILNISLVVLLTFYGFGYLMGISDASISDMVSRIVKIGLIYLFVGPQGWEFFDKFVVSFFKEGTDYLSFMMASAFDDSPELNNAIKNNAFYDKSILFSSVDRVFGLIFSSTVQKKISGLLFASIFGWLYLLFIYYAFLAYIYAISNAVLIYLIAQVFVSVLFVLGPLFFVFTLFAQTKEMFDNWLKQLIGFSLQQIFLLTTLAFFNMLMYEVIKMALGFKVCWDDVWTINIITRISLMSWYTIPSLPPDIDSQNEIGNVGNNDGIPSLFSILFIWVIAELMLKFIEFMANVAADIAGGLKATSLGSGVKSTVKGISDKLSKEMAEYKNAFISRPLDNLDKILFDSGQAASAERKAKKEQLAADKNNKSKLNDTGKSAINKFKRENGAELAAMSKEDQEKKLKEVRDQAIKEKATQMGISPEDLKRLRSQTGHGYVGDNAFLLAYSAAKEGLKDSGTLMTSLDKKYKKVDTKFSSSQAKSALKNTDDVGRAQLIDAVKKGNIYVEESSSTASFRRMEALGGGIKSAAKTLISPKKSLMVNAMKAAAGAVKGGAVSAYKSATSESEYDKATRELVAEGEVFEMKKGTNWARTDSEKKKIRDRVKSNLEKKSKSKIALTSAETAMQLEFESQAIEDLESGKETDIVRSSGAKSSLIGARKHFRSDVKKQLRKANKDSRIKDVSAALEAKRAAAEAEKNSADEDKGHFQAVIDSIENDASFTDHRDQLNEGMRKMKDTSLSAQDRSNARKDVARLASDPEFKKKDAELRVALAGRVNANTRYNNAEEISSSLGNNISTLEDVSEIKESIEEKLKDPNISDDDYKLNKKALQEYESDLGLSYQDGDEEYLRKAKKFQEKYISLKTESSA